MTASESPATQAAKRDAADWALQAAAARERADAIAELAARSHATVRERLEADERATILEAIAAAAADRATLHEAVDQVERFVPDIRSASLRRVAGSQFAWLPRTKAEASPEPTTDPGVGVAAATEPASPSDPIPTQPVSTVTPPSDAGSAGSSPDPVERLAALLTEEAADAEADWWRVETERVHWRRDAVAELHASRHATNAERDAAVAAVERLDGAVRERRTQRDELAASIASLGVAPSDAALPAAGFDAILSHLKASPTSPVAAELVAVAEQMLDARTAVAVAQAQTVTATDLHRRVEAIPAELRRPTELRSSRLDRDQSAAALAAAEHRERLSGQAAGWLLAWADAPRPLPTLPSETLPSARPVDADDASPSIPFAGHTEGALSDRSGLRPPSLRRRTRPGYVDAARTSSYPFDTGSPLDPPALPQTVPVWPGLNLGSSPLSGSTRLFQPGATYQSGYSFGQTRYDLPRELRYPRADSYGGPWSLPGSPTDRLRFRQRTPLRWGPGY